MASFERRDGHRQQTTFMTAMVNSDRGPDVALLRNISTNGASFKGELDLRIGDTITYVAGDSDPRLAKVVWIKDGMFGVEKIEPGPDCFTKRSTPYRSVRAPISATAKIFAMGRDHSAVVLNLSQSGACVRSEAPITRGQLVTLQMDEFTFDAAEVKWSSQGRLGLKFSNSMNVGTLSLALKRLQYFGNGASGRAHAAA